MTEAGQERLDALLGDLAGIRDDQDRRLFIARHPELLDAGVVTKLADMIPRVGREDLERAAGLAEAARGIAETLANREARGRALRASANVAYLKGDNQSALELHEQAAALFREAGNSLEIGRTLSASLQPMALIGQYERAQRAVEEARGIFTALGDERRLARLEINLGNILHRQDRFEEAIDCYRRAHQKLAPAGDVEAVAVSLHNMAVCLISLNRFTEALEVYQQAREFSERHGLPLLVHQADYNIAYLHFFRGEYSRAIGMLQATRARCERLKDPYHAALANLDLAEVYLELNLSEEAAEMARAAEGQFRHLKMGYETAKAIAYEAIALGQEGKGFRAIDLFSRARSLFVEEQNRVWPWLIDLYQALVLSKEGRLFEARHLAGAALEFFQSSRLPVRAALCRLLLGRIATAQGDLQTASRECLAAEGLLEATEAPSLDFQLLFQQGRIAELEGKSEEAYGHFQKALACLESLRSGVRGDELKISFMRNKLEVFESLVEYCLKSGDRGPRAEEAFNYIEQAKSRSLVDLVSQSMQSAAAPGPGQSELVRRIRDLREELNWYYHRLETEQLHPDADSPDRIGALESRARAAEKDLMRFWRSATSIESDLSGLPAAAPPSLEKVRAAVPEDAILVEYFRVRDRIVAALLTREELRIVPVTVVSKVSSLVRLLQFQLSKFRLGSEYIRKFALAIANATLAHLRDLHAELIAPLGLDLAGRQLLIVPHDLLHYVPFHALFDGERYLVDSASVAYAPSAGVYALCTERTASTGGSLILGMPDRQAPFILDEVQSVAAALPSPQLVLGPRATAEVLKEQGAQSRFIHIATHGYFRQDNPAFSGIHLGDAYLSLYDFYRMKLPAELITLSGCVTGLSAVAAGDELVGLVRGLLFCGAQSLLVTLWEVNDRSTAEFMKAFYRHLLGGADKASAVSKAMMEVRAAYPHPYYWAPFALVGKTGPS